MKLKVPILFLFSVVIFWGSSCRKNFEYAPSAGNLSFSQDTVFLDTIFSNIGSSTYSFKVYNNTKDDVLIPSIRLRNGNSSSYRLNVDGAAGKEFSNISINAEDSLFVFVETTVNLDATDTVSLLYTDAVQFDSGTDEQNVELVTLVQDAVFLFPATNQDGTKETILLDSDDGGNQIRVQGFVLTEDQLSFTNEKPYVIYGFAVVPDGQELVIEPGARVHFHKDSGLLIRNGAKITINGALSENQETLENEVIFEGDRLESTFATIPGQWTAVYIQRGSVGNQISYLTLKNANIGILVEGDEDLTTPTLTIENSQIYNSTNHNLWARNAFVEAKNLVLGNSGSSSLYCNLGGNYSFVHCTIANYWNTDFRTVPALQIDNFQKLSNGNEVSSDLINAEFKNCIIAGNNQLELLLKTNGTNSFNYEFRNCMIQFDDIQDSFSDDALYDFDTNPPYEAILLNGNTEFFNVNQNDFRIALSSDATNVGNPDFAIEVPVDIIGMDRTTQTDLGAFQAADKN
ncbi:hypothetical protein [Maribacter sp. 2210JD10-5]|uniref:hypothetical protein n=1 Tax=Maribacter sp. 2210JD10-5 TaxID=3386272 RepID=UPI0039BCDB66